MYKAFIFMSLVLGLGVNAAETSTLKQGEVNNVEKTNQIGFGIQAGTSTGINAEYWLTEDAVAVAAFAPEHSNALVTLGGNYMFRNVISGNVKSVTPYVGGGILAVFGTNNDYLDRTDSNRNFAMAAQVPCGLAWLPEAQRFDIFAQISPSVQVVPVMMGFMAADLGAHFYF
jgi:hypothetical protein